MPTREEVIAALEREPVEAMLRGQLIKVGGGQKRKFEDLTPEQQAKVRAAQKAALEDYKRKAEKRRKVWMQRPMLREEFIAWFESIYKSMAYGQQALALKFKAIEHLVLENKWVTKEQLDKLYDAEWERWQDQMERMNKAELEKVKTEARGETDAATKPKVAMSGLVDSDGNPLPLSAGPAGEVPNEPPPPVVTSIPAAAGRPAEPDPATSSAEEPAGPDAGEAESAPPSAVAPHGPSHE